MNILEELNTLLRPTNVPVETGHFSSPAPDTYIVLVPIIDRFPISADNYPLNDVQEVRISLFSKSNYLTLKKQITRLLLNNDFTITDRRYNGFESGSGYHQLTIDVAKVYDIDTEEN